MAELISEPTRDFLSAALHTHTRAGTRLRRTRRASTDLETMDDTDGKIINTQSKFNVEFINFSRSKHFEVLKQEKHRCNY